MPKPPKKPEGRPGVDERGVSVWNWVEGNEAIGTDVVRALGDELSLEPSSENPDPYSQLGVPDANPKHGRSLDDMRRLNEEIKRAREQAGAGPHAGADQKSPVQQARVARLRWAGRELLLDERKPSISVGRGKTNDVVLAGDGISRLHARIELRQGVIVLIDESRNGTFVRGADGNESCVQGASVALEKEGLIGFGRPPRPDSPRTISFSCEQT